MNIGIIGGTFDPIHNGHLIIAEYARTSLNLDKVLFIPSGMHPFKDNKNITDAKHRMEMILLAIDSNIYFEASSLEINRTGITYTIDTISSLKEKYPKDDLYFIFGLDILFELDKWEKIEQLNQLCKFVLFDRPSKEDLKIYERIVELKSSYNIDIKMVRSPIIDISSTEIRERVRKKISIRYLVPEVVEEYILNNKLYKKLNTNV